jgi:hypothetical protein
MMSLLKNIQFRNGLYVFLDFLFILIGISLSFQLEERRAQARKVQLKNQSLERILRNLDYDLAEFEVNMEVHEAAAASCFWLFENRHQEEAWHPDSLGYHCAVCLDGQTIFVDNQEEYLSLRNSGLLAQIEDSALVRLLQEKHIQHQYMHKIEDYNAELVQKSRELLFTHFETGDSLAYALDFITLRRWNGREVPPSFFEFAQDISEWHESYLWAMEEQRDADQHLMRLIQSEITP